MALGRREQRPSRGAPGLGRVVGVCSIGKTRGCTTVAVTVAWLIRSEGGCESYLVEADEHGGDLNSWWQLGAARSAAALTGRFKAGTPVLDAVAAAAAAGGLVPVVCTGSDGASVEGLMRSWSRNTSKNSERPLAERVVVIDAGRWHRRQMSNERLAVCDTVIALVEPTVVGVDRAKQALRDLEQCCDRVVLVQMGSKPYDADTVAEQIGAQVQTAALDKRAVLSVKEGDEKLGVGKSRTASSLRRLLWPEEQEPENSEDAPDGTDAVRGGGRLGPKGRQRPGGSLSGLAGAVEAEPAVSCDG